MLHITVDQLRADLPERYGAIFGDGGFRFLYEQGVVFENAHHDHANNYHPQRSGDVMIVFEPHHFINDFDGLTLAAHHGSPWAYDTHVPVIFAGFGLTARRVERPIRTVDIAPAIASLIAIDPPAGAIGVVSEELP